MIEILKRLLRASNYEEFSDTEGSEVSIFTSSVFGDAIMVAAYSTEDLIEYETSLTTEKVMSAFDDLCRIKPGCLKDTSLIICLKIMKPSDLEEVKNATLLAEENAYGFRKFVLIYSDESINNIKQIQADSIRETIYDKLQSGFIDYTGSSPSQPTFDEYDVILQLFIKLPFMNLSNSTSDSESSPGIATFLSKKLKRFESLMTFVTEANEEYDQTSLGIRSGKGTPQDFDLQIDELLSKSFIDSMKPDTRELK